MQRNAGYAVTVGIILTTGALIGSQLTQPATDDVGQHTAPSAATQAPPSADPGAVTHLVPDIQREPEAVDPTPAAAPASPVRLAMPSLGVDAPVVDVGLEDDGGMEIPHDVDTVGWYELGVAPGEASGTAVISGHVDSREQGPGAFWDLRRMDIDDIVTVEHGDGHSSEWRVVARRTYGKDELPIADIFTRFGEPRLVLITCDGPFDRDARSYRDNVVIYTVPVPVDG